MYIRAPPWESTGATRQLDARNARGKRGGIYHEMHTVQRQPNELTLWGGLPASSAGTHGDMRIQDDTSESQLIAR